MAEPGGYSLAQLLSTLADRDRWPAGEIRGPLGDRGMGPTQRARDQAGILRKVLSRADVDDGRTFRRADQAGELVNGDRGGRRHGASSGVGGTRFFGMSPRGEIASPWGD